MKKTEVYLAIERLKEAASRLEEALPRVKDDLDRDGVIQRFEFTFELFWKTLKFILEYHGVSCASPRQCLKEAFKMGLIEDDEVFLDMLTDRNLSSHVYEEKTAEEIYQRIRKVYSHVLKETIRKLEERL